jgi:hypothetical protein
MPDDFVFDDVLSDKESITLIFFSKNFLIKKLSFQCESFFITLADAAYSSSKKGQFY